MTQVFADDETATRGMIARGGRIPVQANSDTQQAGPEQAAEPPPRSSPALTPGKGVRMVRCVGCCRDTLPRPGDGAPLCGRCSEVLAHAASGPPAALAGSFSGWTMRWLRRRDAELS